MKMWQSLLMVFAVAPLLVGCATPRYERPYLLPGKGATIEGRHDALAEIGIYKIDGKYVDDSFMVKWAKDLDRSDYCVTTPVQLMPGKHTVTVNYAYKRDRFHGTTLEQVMYDLWLVAEAGKKYKLAGTLFTGHSDTRYEVWIEDVGSFTEKDLGTHKMKEVRRVGGLVGSPDEPKPEPPAKPEKK